MAGILVIFGTRPEAIKLAPVIQELRRRNLPVCVCTTGQHRDMLDPILRVFGIQPAHDLDVMEENQAPLETTARIFERLPAVLDAVRPACTLVQGDTTSTLAAALVSFHRQVPVAHVEAGLRTGDKLRPFPEEANRRLTTVLADVHFAPTRQAAENLTREGIATETIFITGNTVVDAVEAILRKPISLAGSLGLCGGRMVVVTAHRRESLGTPLGRICDAVSSLAAAHCDLTVVFPVHRNPSVRESVAQRLGTQPRVLLVDPLPYPEFVHLLRRSCLVLTDSGGVQEEAPSIRTPVLVMRDVTERPEALASGWVELVGTETERILKRAEAWLKRDPSEFPPASANPFGDGKASERIADILSARLTLAAGRK
ncbi:MAG TPA: UDP-N-acetylglucosamine 2-epimerase (non-hydrolyzing) [Patescibacteria group bacterium]|nr:UDP-N-acetylglucosamine 2-epimerase (non-hydrolyzing) [Patescibacteria group bacterium]